MKKTKPKKKTSPRVRNRGFLLSGDRSNPLTARQLKDVLNSLNEKELDLPLWRSEGEQNSPVTLVFINDLHAGRYFADGTPVSTDKRYTLYLD